MLRNVNIYYVYIFLNISLQKIFLKIFLKNFIKTVKVLKALQILHLRLFKSPKALNLFAYSLIILLSKKLAKSDVRKLENSFRSEFQACAMAKTLMAVRHLTTCLYSSNIAHVNGMNIVKKA